MDNVDLNKLHTFFAIVEAGSVTGAAERLGLTRSAISQSLSSLESSLDLELFHRAGRRLVLTDQGRHLHQRFETYRNMLHQTLEELRPEPTEVRGMVRIGLYLGFPRVPLARVVTRFTQEHAAGRLKILFALQEELTELLLAGRLDFVLSFDPRRNVSRRIRSERLFRQELVLVGARDLVPRRVDLEALASIPVVDYYQGSPLIHRWVRHHFRVRRVTIPVRVWAATTDLVLDLVLSGAGIGVLPRPVAEPHLRRGAGLRVIETARAPLTDSIWLNEPVRPARDARLDAFRSIARAELAD